MMRLRRQSRSRQARSRRRSPCSPQLAINCFHNASPTGGWRVRGLDPHKEAATLATYFRYWKQFLCHHYRVVYGGCHFTKVEGVLRTPNDGIRVVPS